MKMGNRGGGVKVFCGIRSSPLVFLQRPAKSSKSKTWKRRPVKQKRVARLMRLKAEKRKISEEQSSLKVRQGQVKEKIKAVESECRTVRQETILVMQQSACTKLRLDLMFKILKARQNNDFAGAADLTCALRELIAQTT